jgi:quercetin dioxygenase-like cupin family protein
MSKDRFPNFEKGPNRRPPEIDATKQEQAGQRPTASLKFGLSDTSNFDRPGFDGHVHVSPEQGLGFTALTIDVNGEHPRKRIIEGTRTYYVVDGNGTFTLDSETHHVQPGDLFVILEYGEYSYEGRMTLFELNIPSDLSPTGEVVDEKLDQ